VQISNDRHFVYALQGEERAPPAAGGTQGEQTIAKVQRREVRIGVEGEDWLEVVSGLQPEEEVVTAGLEGLSNGAQVRPARNVNPFGGGARTEVQQPQMVPAVRE